MTFSLENEADLQAFDLHCHPDSVDFRFTYQGVESRLHFAMPGTFSVRNVLAAMGACLQLGVCLETIIGALSEVKGVRGRNEILTSGRNFTVICDYAHSRIASIISSAR